MSTSYLRMKCLELDILELRPSFFSDWLGSVGSFISLSFQFMMRREYPTINLSAYLMYNVCLSSGKYHDFLYDVDNIKSLFNDSKIR